MTDFLKLGACGLALILAPVAGKQGSAFADGSGIYFDTLDVTGVTEEDFEDIHEDAPGDLEEDRDDLEDLEDDDGSKDDE